VSFVSPKHVKQMADSEKVMAKLNASLPAGVELPEIHRNCRKRKGLERALATPGVTGSGIRIPISAYSAGELQHDARRVAPADEK